MINLGNLSWLDKSMIYSLPHYHLKHVLVMYIGCPSCLPLCKAHLSFGQISVLSPFNIIQSCSIPQIVSKQTTIWTTCWIVAPNSPNVTHPPKNYTWNGHNQPKCAAKTPPRLYRRVFLLNLTLGTAENGGRWDGKSLCLLVFGGSPHSSGL